jgi:7-carboxy-7-deazaguanine synthase
VESEYRALDTFLSSEQREALFNGLLLPVMEEFYTLQGEGFNTGLAAYFIRLGGCDVGCHWCDVKESWNPRVHPLQTIEEIVARAAASPAKAVVITGGEPLLYNLEPFTRLLKERGISVFLETSGAYMLEGTIDWICVSPKKFKAPLQGMLDIAHELKVIVFNRSDLDWAEQYRVKVNSGCKLYLQPEWSKAEKNMPWIIDYIKVNPVWRISLQAHKYMHIP